jgi:hypothetical protein
MHIPDHISESIETIFWVCCRKYMSLLLCFKLLTMLFYRAFDLRAERFKIVNIVSSLGKGSKFPAFPAPR